MNHFNIISSEEISSRISKREGETKLGERLTFVNKIDDLRQVDPSYVILGIPESIGPRANFGKMGAEYAWDAFLNSFLNTQYNSFISDRSIVLLGAFDLTHLNSTEENISQLRKSTQVIDDLVYPLIHSIKEAGHTPIIIGGGHNNCYPIIKGVSMAVKEKIDCINIDPHADFRAVEGRHSGNGFSSAYNNGVLDKYHVYGLHENYNSEYLLEQFQEIDGISYTTFESILFNQNSTKALSLELEEFTQPKVGIEIDLDSISNMPSSAYTPSGFSVENVRKILNQITQIKNAHYLHICEGAPNTKQESIIVGKTISYLISDFIKNTASNQ